MGWKNPRSVGKKRGIPQGDPYRYENLFSVVLVARWEGGLMLAPTNGALHALQFGFEVPVSGPLEENLNPRCLDCKDAKKIIREFIRREEPRKGCLDWEVEDCRCRKRNTTGR